MILPPDGKWKMIFLKKTTKTKQKHGNMIFTSNVLKRWYFQKGSHRDMIFFVISGKVVFFSRKHGDGKRKRSDLSQDIHGSMIFSIWHVPCPLRKKNQRGSYPAKIHLKVINIPDRHPRKSSSNFLYLHGDLYRRFHIYCSLAKKIRKLNI